MIQLSRLALSFLLAAMFFGIGCSDETEPDRMEGNQTVPTDTQGTAEPAESGTPVVDEQLQAKDDNQRQLEAKREQLTSIGRGLLNYHEAHGEFPAANTNFESEHKGLSWRVHLLPFIENTRLYEQFHLDEPWDSPHNKSLISQMPDIYRTPELSDQTRTTYQVFVGEQLAFNNDRGLKISTYRDGLSNIGFVVETGPEFAETWTKPGGLTLEEQNPVKTLGRPYPYGFLFLMGDTQVREFDVDFLRAGNLKKILTRNGLEVIQFPDTNRTSITKDASPPSDEEKGAHVLAGDSEFAELRDAVASSKWKVGAKVRTIEIILYPDGSLGGNRERMKRSYWTPTGKNSFALFEKENQVKYLEVNLDSRRVRGSAVWKNGDRRSAIRLNAPMKGSNSTRIAEDDGDTAPSDPALETIEYFKSRSALVSTSRETGMLTVNFVRSPITDSELTHLTKLEKLGSLNLFANMKVTNVGLVHLKELPNLTALGLMGDKFTNESIASLKSLPKLNTLILIDGTFDDSCVRHLKQFPHLTSLSLMHTKISDNGLREIQTMDNLKSLNLMAYWPLCRSRFPSEVTDAGVRHLVKMDHLQKLFLDNNKITDAGLVPLSQMTNLTHLSLGSTQVTNVGLTHLHKLQKLTFLNLSKTRVTNAGVDKLRAALPDCQIVK